MRLFIYCSDPREEADLETKISKELLFPNEKIMRLANCGYPMVLAHPIHFRSGANWLLEQIDFMIKNFQPEQVVSIGHDCGWYETVPVLAKINLFDKKRDIANIHRMLLRRHPNQDFKSFFDITQGEQFKFEHFAA